MTHALTISVEGKMGHIDSDDLPAMQSFVGGFVQAIDNNIEGVPFTMYANEEGKIFGLAPNVVATALVDDVIMSGDYIAGNAILLGAADSEGGNTDVPTILVDGLTLALNA